MRRHWSAGRNSSGRRCVDGHASAVCAPVSGSMSPGKGPYRFTAPVSAGLRKDVGGRVQWRLRDERRQGRVLHGRSRGRSIANGAASFVIYANGSVNVGAWGSDLSMTSRVVSVRQNLCHSCRRAPHRGRGERIGTRGVRRAASIRAPSQFRHRSSMEIGCRHYGQRSVDLCNGPGLSPYQLAQLLVRARVIRGWNST